MSERQIEREREWEWERRLSCVPQQWGTHTHEKKELPTGETVKHLLPLPHTAEAVQVEGGSSKGRGGSEVSYAGSMELLLKVVQLR